MFFWGGGGIRILECFLVGLGICCVFGGWIRDLGWLGVQPLLCCAWRPLPGELLSILALLRYLLDTAPTQ